MGFKWNGVHTSEAGIVADIDILPGKEPVIITEEITGRDGFLDFSTFNGQRRLHYRPREWVYRCGIQDRSAANIGVLVNAFRGFFASYSGYLEADDLPGVRWKGVITSAFEFEKLDRTTVRTTVNIRTQPFAEAFDVTEVSLAVTADGNYAVNNPGTWYVTPTVTLTGTVTAGAVIAGVELPYSGAVTDAPLYGLELTPGENSIAVSGFTGTVTLAFTALYDM